MKRRVIRQRVIRTTDGLLNNLADLILAQLFFGLSVVGAGYNSREVYKAAASAQEIFALTPYTSFKNALGALRRKGLINSLKTKVKEPLITQRGQERLKRIFPVYEEDRPWDGKIYLIVYDVPEQKRDKRNLLRDKLKNLGCALAQQSVWITPYNPRQILNRLAEEHRLEGQIIISDTGTNGSIGDKSLPQTLWEFYGLEETNQRYKEFLDSYDKKAHHYDLVEASFKFFSVLRDDPQLPYELLPPNWYGDEAWEFYKKITKGNILLGEGD